MNYQKICSDLLKDLPSRTVSVIERRFGLQEGKRETLEAIGASYNITRERVRQIENEGFSKIKPILEKDEKLLKHFQNALTSFGGVKKEDELLEVLGGKNSKNQVFFLLTNFKDFERVLEDNDCYTCWAVKKASLNNAKNVIKSTIGRLNKENQVLDFKDLLKGQKVDKETFVSYINISKNIGKNPGGKYGLNKWIEINPKGIKDKAYLVLKGKNEPIHFTQVAVMIGKLPFAGNNKVHTATVHNELIKDERFVLVGRGLYALKEWGYEPGIVRDIIVRTLKDSNTALTKEQILSKVSKQRFVKENTITLNLQNKNYFLRNSQGKYTIKES
ncbi:hypothetical protein KKA24_00820 [Patescibacteria group bacterium]|nr:hypothetical protein [Patescibacteria group bacterium]